MFIVMICLLSGCAGSPESQESIKLEKYKYIYQTVSDNNSFLDSPSYYDLSIVMSKLSDKSYRYDITIDNPQIAMYDVQVMAVENNLEYELSNKMMPTIGILEDDSYNMVPYQVDAERGYVKGLILSGEIDNPIVNLKIRVSYKDYLLVKETNEYYNITVDYDSQFAEITEGEEEVDETSEDNG